VKHFSFELKAMSPLAIRSDHAPGGSEIAPFITGTTLVGSLAAVHRLLYAERTKEFEALFLRGEVQYPHLYPASFKDKGMEKAKLPVYPLPKTAQTCKRFSGFRYIFEGEEDVDDRHGVRDGLLDWAIFALANRVGFRDGKGTPLVRLKDHQLCPVPECGASMDHFTGYYRQNDDDEQHMIAAITNTRLQTHTGINRQSGTVEESILYNRQVFDEQMRFWGMVKLPEHLATEFQNFVGEVAHSSLVRIGTGRTRGMGKVSLTVESMEEEEDRRFRVFKERLEAFNKNLGDLAREVHLNHFKPFYFALTLHSPVILCDHLLRYRGTISGDTLAEETDLPESTFDLVYQAASVQRVRGWNELWGTPRTNEYAIDTGSVFLFASSIDLDDGLLRALFKLEENGIGRRRAEGFGRVCVSDPFHLEVELR
jgi:CRISPR-associated protein Csx10